VLFLPADYDVIKVFNNNVVLANHLGTEKVLIKKGIGFSNKAGDKIPADTEFERIFAIENPEIGSKFNQLINRVQEAKVKP
jgi:transcriptional antiterminator